MSGKWWRGDSASDFEQFLRQSFRSDLLGHRVPMCEGCGCQVFRLVVEDGSWARRACVACGAAHAILQSIVPQTPASSPKVTCPCGKNQFEIAVGVAGGPKVAAVAVAQRCLACGSLGLAASWERPYAAVETLLEQA